MGKLLKRSDFSRQISNVSLDYEVWREMDLKYYFGKMKRYCATKKVFVIDEKGWGLTSERWLVDWFEKNYEKLGHACMHEKRPKPKFNCVSVKYKRKLRRIAMNNARASNFVLGDMITSFLIQS